MRVRAFGLGLLAVGGLLPLAMGQEPAKAGDNKDYPELSRLIHKMVGGQFPKIIEHDAGWGKTIPVPDGLRLQRLRTRVMVGGREELPHGLWKKVKARLEDPARDLTVRVRSLEQKMGGIYRVTLDVDARLRGEMEVIRWQKGLRLLNLVAQGEVVVGLAVACDVKVALDPKQPFGKVKIEPSVTELQISLKEFTLQQVSLRRLGPVLEGEQAKAAGEQVKGMVEQTLQGLGPDMKERFNQAIARSLADGKGTVSVGDLLKGLSGRPKKD